jgi:ribosome biogenesis GTPase
MAKKKKVRVDLRKNRNQPPRERGWTKGYQEHGFAEEATAQDERVRARGELSRRRTIIQESAPEVEATGDEPAEMPTVDASACLPGRVLQVFRENDCVVEVEDGRRFRCTVRWLLRSLTTHERSIVATGDRVWVRPAPGAATVAGVEGTSPTPRASAPGGAPGATLDGVVERVEPRHGLLTRASRGREQVLVANVDQVVFVMSLVEPDLKPHLIDRYLASAIKGEIRPLLCLNKTDLVELPICQPIVGFYSQLGVPTLLTSAATGLGIGELRRWLSDRQTVFMGQSGVGKSSLLNAVQPELGLRVREVSEGNQKGRHTTTTAQLIKLEFGGWVVDTPGVRQFQLWDVLPEEVEGFFPEFRPFVALCAFPDCTHTHEQRCAVKRAVYRRWISETRYLSYLGMFRGEGA